MACDPFTLRIFVPVGDPEGVRIIDRMNWTGLGRGNGPVQGSRMSEADTCRKLVVSKLLGASEVIHFADALVACSRY